MTHPIEWSAYLTQMEHISDIELTEDRRAEVLVQLTRIARMAQPLMDYPLDDRIEVAGVYRL
ncbi:MULTISPECIES: oxalurate catabolism protein HpxX [Tatumella]|uniref:Oxalurate catabolism protein HpxX n=1 Tax=Tatumella punctata TaxID=399969 RepID=A0ABW1VTR9_9GAMM|nr:MULTISPECIES: oxalurate catabolism protein HpxX [unclassified Tatumella]MBS0857025.1 oxalurate catabolism protein HpxX [Tatumella sp. JGM16]MBS0878325.1 oxalurate catabolism protein HpxX [Tatumella sp. JGM82]MBS0891814.1 oxalurate catabolism protein HpxX [Tatumella sp. JGM94]MBS0894631.1 oxalurate catabolism protein HpxX [Tatumella sp. JGM130]MBS0903053.1 oxalurate catabolism protein HpxX [Tatumella sp. JGM100]